MFPRGWLIEHPLTAADLEQECEYLQAAGFRLRGELNAAARGLPRRPPISDSRSELRRRPRVGQPQLRERGAGLARNSAA